MEGDTPGPELVPSQRSFRKETLTLLHRDHAHRGVLPSAGHPTPSGGGAGSHPACPLCCQARHSTAVPQRRVHLFREAAAKGRGRELLMQPWRLGAHPLEGRPRAHRLVWDPILPHWALCTAHAALLTTHSVHHMSATGFAPSKEAPNYRMTQEGCPRWLLDRRLGEEGTQAKC